MRDEFEACAKHFNVRASGSYCPICLLDERDALRAEVARARDMASHFHTELDKQRAETMKYYKLWQEAMECI
jgi:hypothetical protein